MNAEEIKPELSMKNLLILAGLPVPPDEPNNNVLRSLIPPDEPVNKVRLLDLPYEHETTYVRLPAPPIDPKTKVRLPAPPNEPKTNVRLPASPNEPKTNVRMRKKFSDDEEDASSSEDEELQHEIKLIKIMSNLPHYKPSQPLLQALDANFTYESLSQSTEGEMFNKYLKTQILDYNNVCTVLGTLLSMEDVSTMQLYTQFMQPNVMLQKINKHTYSFMLAKSEANAEEIIAPFQDEVVLIPIASLLASPLPSQLILAQLPHSHESLPAYDQMRRLTASVDRVSRTSIEIQFKRGGATPGNTLLNQRFFVIPRSRRTNYRLMYRALHLLEESPQLRRYLFPQKKPIKSALPQVAKLALKLFNPSIDDNLEQLQAVQNIVDGPNPQAPYIVFGPPGTGKTTTIVEAILQLRLQQPRSRILVTAGSNSACDTIATRICDYFATNELMKAELAHRATQSRLVTEDVEMDYQLIRVFSRSIFAKGLSSVPSLLLKHSNCAKSNYEQLSTVKLRKYGIIVATLCTVGRYVTSNLGKFKYFTHIFIDEAGASTEPETLIGITGIKQHADCHVILSGDHKQLGAIIKNNRAAVLGLKYSLMERLLHNELYAMDGNGNYDRTLQTRLRRNYRSHPEIVGLFNRLYYNNELIPEANPKDVNMAANWAMLPNAQFPIIFQATHGTTTRDTDSTSSFNSLEASVVCWYVNNILVNGFGSDDVVYQRDIGIVAPYAAQCRVIKDMLRRQGHPNVEVGSVENYQGREKPIIIATLVRSFSGMGFMRNPRRINVLLSRAKSLLILVGNPVTLRRHRDIRYVINECKLHGNYVFKKRVRNQRPLILKEEEEEQEEEEQEEEEQLAYHEPQFWYEKMPKDIPIPLPFRTPDKSSSSGIHTDETESTDDSSSSSDSSDYHVSTSSSQLTSPVNSLIMTQLTI